MGSGKTCQALPTTTEAVLLPQVAHTIAMVIEIMTTTVCIVGRAIIIATISLTNV